MIDAASCTKQLSFKQSCRVVMGSEDASGNRRELLEDPRCLNMVLQERVARSHIVVFNGCFVAAPWHELGEFAHHAEQSCVDV